MVRSVPVIRHCWPLVLASSLHLHRLPTVALQLVTMATSRRRFTPTADETTHRDAPRPHIGRSFTWCQLWAADTDDDDDDDDDDVCVFSILNIFVQVSIFVTVQYFYPSIMLMLIGRCPVTILYLLSALSLIDNVVSKNQLWCFSAILSSRRCLMQILRIFYSSCLVTDEIWCSKLWLDLIVISWLSCRLSSKLWELGTSPSEQILISAVICCCLGIRLWFGVSD